MFDYYAEKTIMKAEAGCDFQKDNLGSGNGTMILVRLKMGEDFPQGATYVLLKNIPGQIVYCSPLQIIKPDGTSSTFIANNVLTISNIDHTISLAVENDERSKLDQETVISFLMVLNTLQTA